MAAPMQRQQYQWIILDMLKDLAVHWSVGAHTARISITGKLWRKVLSNLSLLYVLISLAWLLILRAV
jgi:hypothetical protein